MEDALQMSVANHLRDYHPKWLWWHTPNGGYRKQIVSKTGKKYSPEAMRLKKLGALAGVSDIFSPVPSGVWQGFVCELKCEKNTTSTRQDDFLLMMKALGYYTCVAYDIEEFKAHHDFYLRGVNA